jgi:hypothetical protein
MPEFMPRSKFTDYLEFFSVFQDIPLLTSAEMLPNPSHDPTSKKWEVKICHKGNLITVRPKHQVMATGVLGEPNIPYFEDMGAFKGSIIRTNSHKNANGWKGKKDVVLGAVRATVGVLYVCWSLQFEQGVTGTDIALEADTVGAEVLIVQRSPMAVGRFENIIKNIDRIYSRDRPTEDPDRLREATPWNYFMRLCNNHLVPISEREEKGLHEALRARGFLVGWECG